MKIQNDERWMHLAGGYRTDYDPRPALAQLRSGQNEGAAWSELWNELHHQGDVGEASYAAVPELVKIYQQRGIIHWQTYAMVATIELQRTEAGNPKLPVWLADDYLTAIQELAVAGARDIFQASEPDTIRAILGLIAIARGLRVCGRLLAQYSEPEIAAMLVSE